MKNPREYGPGKPENGKVSETFAVGEVLRNGQEHLKITKLLNPRPSWTQNWQAKLVGSNHRVVVRTIDPDAIRPHLSNIDPAEDFMLLFREMVMVEKLNRLEGLNLDQVTDGLRGNVEKSKESVSNRNIIASFGQGTHNGIDYTIFELAPKAWNNSENNPAIRRLVVSRLLQVLLTTTQGGYAISDFGAGKEDRIRYGKPDNIKIIDWNVFSSAKIAGEVKNGTHDLFRRISDIVDLSGRPSDHHFLRALFLIESQLKGSGKKDSQILLEFLPKLLTFYDAQSRQNINGQVQVIKDEILINTGISESLAKSSLGSLGEQALVPRASELATLRKLANISRII